MWLPHNKYKLTYWFGHSASHLDLAKCTLKLVGWQTNPILSIMKQKSKVHISKCGRPIFSKENLWKFWKYFDRFRLQSESASTLLFLWSWVNSENRFIIFTWLRASKFVMSYKESRKNYFICSISFLRECVRKCIFKIIWPIYHLSKSILIKPTFHARSNGISLAVHKGVGE